MVLRGFFSENREGSRLKGLLIARIRGEVVLISMRKNDLSYSSNVPIIQQPLFLHGTQESLTSFAAFSFAAFFVA